jgi:hypothetical protein
MLRHVKNSISVPSAQETHPSACTAASMSSTCLVNVYGCTPLFMHYAYPTISKFLTPLLPMLHSHYTGTTDCHKLTVVSTGRMPFAQNEQITDHSSSFVHSISRFTIVHLMLGKHALPALVNKLAIW